MDIAEAEDREAGNKIPYIANNPKRLYQIQLSNERKYARRKDAEMGIRPDPTEDDE
jgi:hypothetical protein